VHVTTAPATSFAPKGSAIAGDFTCTAVPRFPKDPDGKTSRTSDGQVDFQKGGFNVVVR
jgi:hypothetical protein